MSAPLMVLLKSLQELAGAGAEERLPNCFCHCLKPVLWKFWVARDCLDPAEVVGVEGLELRWRYDKALADSRDKCSWSLCKSSPRAA